MNRIVALHRTGIVVIMQDDDLARVAGRLFWGSVAAARDAARASGTAVAERVVSTRP